MSEAVNTHGRIIFPRRHDLRFFFFALAILIYALFGSPTPDNPSSVEALIGIGLVLGVGLSSVPLLFYRPDPSCRWLRLLFFYGASIVLITGLLSANDPALIIRDIIPFLFICLPLFFRSLIEETSAREQMFLILCWLLGIVFAGRVLGPHYDILSAQEELFYLANSPILLFTAICAAGYGFYYLRRPFSGPSFLKMTVCLAAALFCLAAMSLDVQRATIGAVFLSVLILTIHTGLKAPLRLVPLVLFLGAGVFFFSSVFAELVQALSAKTIAVGFNSRLEEISAILQSAEPSVMSVLFGQGWGATYHSPAVGMMDVPFTHSFLSYVFLKGGLVMLLLALMVFVSALRRLHNIYLRGDIIPALALFWALVIPYFLYASHKSLDFGLVLLLIYSLGTDRGERAKND